MEKPTGFRSRILGLKRLPKSKIRQNPNNWRIHTEGQKDVLRQMLADVGFAGALLGRRLPGGEVELIDGHLRLEEIPEGAQIPVLVTDLNEQEAAKVLATFDPIGKMAQTDVEALERLLKEIGDVNGPVEALLKEVRGTTNEFNLEQPSEPGGFAGGDGDLKGFVVEIKLSDDQGNSPEFKTELAAFCQEHGLKWKISMR